MVAEPGIHVATLLQFHPTNRDAAKPVGSAAWVRYRELIAPAESDLGVTTVLDDPIQVHSGDCGSTSWDQLLIQHFPDVATLGTVLRSPERAEAIEYWDPAVATFRRVVGLPLSNPETWSPAAAGRPVDRILLAQSLEPMRLQRAITAEAVFLGERGSLLLQHRIPPDLNEVDNPWDVLTVTRYSDLETLERSDADPELAIIRQQRNAAAHRICELKGAPPDL